MDDPVAANMLLVFLQAFLVLQWEKALLLQSLLTIRRRRRGLEQRRRLRRKILVRSLLSRRSPIVWAHQRSGCWWDTIVPDLNSQRFVENFRVSRESFRYICDQVRGPMTKKDTNFRLSVPLQKRVAIVLWKLASGVEYRTISHLFGVGLSTVYNCVLDFCNATIEVLLPRHIKKPDANRLSEMASYFLNRWRIPQCVGAIDGSHIPIIAPHDYAKDYYNRKGWHSIVLQAVVDGKGQIWDACAGFAGSVHDARVLRQSNLWKHIHDGPFLGQQQVNISGCNVGHYIIGDPAYPLQTWLMKPFSDTGRLSRQQLNYNYRISCARSVVETAFGKLKGRWRCLMKRDDCTVELCKKMVLTCCVLHNICEEHGEIFAEDLPLPCTDAEINPDQDVAHGGDTEGARIRAALLEYFSRED